jgi:hypothetical protein
MAGFTFGSQTLNDQMPDEPLTHRRQLFLGSVLLRHKTDIHVERLTGLLGVTDRRFRGFFFPPSRSTTTGGRLAGCA